MQFQSLTAKGSNVRGDASSHYVATVSQRMDNPEAYAELFAAAPDMLAVLHWARGCVPFPSDCHSAIVAAIDKAEGR